VIRTLLDIWLSSLRMAVSVRMSGITVAFIRLVRLLFPVVPKSNIPGPAVGGRRVAGMWVISPETTSAVFLATAGLAVARRRHLLRRAGTRPS
jgi:hypothetical protein